MSNDERAASLDAYRRALASVAPMDAETEREVARAYQGGDARAGERLIVSSLPFVIRVAKEYRRWGIPMEDLIQQGNLGLLRAAQKFDPDQSCRLVTYAAYWIRAEIRDYVVRSYRIVRLGSTRTERKAMRLFRREGVDSVEELAEQSGMPLGRCQKLWPLLKGRDQSLDAQTEERGPMLDRVSGSFEDPEERLTRMRREEGTRAALGEALDSLDVRERIIIGARLLADEPRTLESLGDEMGVSKERVRQLEARAHGKLRAALAAFHPQAA